MSIFEFFLHVDLHDRDILRFHEYIWDNEEVRVFNSLHEVPDILLDCTSFRVVAISPDEYPYTGYDILYRFG